MRDIEDVIDAFGIRNLIEINKTEKTYKYNWRTIELFGADNQQKLRWWSRDILYCNEANELLRDQEFFQLMIRTKDKIFIDFNPDNEDIWINQELEIKRAREVWDVEIIISTYKDNKFLPEQQVKEIERLATTNPQYWKIYWLGEYGRLEWVIFQNREIIDELPAESSLIWYWQDFWFTNDPTTLVGVYRWNKWIVVDEMIYETGMTNQDIVSRFKDLWIGRNDEIIADSAEPKSIAEIYGGGFNIKPVDKWPDSIKFGIDIMLEQKIYITSKSKNLVREFKWYTRATDKDGRLTNKPIDSLNHGIDAIRYLCMMKLKSSQPFYYTFTV